MTPAEMRARLTSAAVETLYEGEDLCGFYAMGNDEPTPGTLIVCTGLGAKRNSVLWDATDGQQYRVTVTVTHIGAIPPERNAPDA